MSVHDLPLVNALLNSISAVLLVLGWGLIRTGRWRWHRNVMLSAFLVSALFLVSYLTYHLQVGSVRFSGQGWVRPLYFVLLVSHVFLAAIILPLALLTLWRGLAGRFRLHRRIARWTLPLWLYVSLTGVLVYLMLYVVFPSPAATAHHP